MSNMAATKALQTQIPLSDTSTAGRRTNCWTRVGLTVAFLIVLFFAILFVAPNLLDGRSRRSRRSPRFYRCPGLVARRNSRWSNYPEALNVFPFVRYATNTLRIAVPVAIGTTLSSAVVAYGFSRLRWPGRDAVFYLVLATLMIPTWVTLVPLYILFNDIGWVNTYRPLIVPSFFGDAFSIFLLRQFFLRQPQDLVDAARVDGASHLRIFAADHLAAVPTGAGGGRAVRLHQCLDRLLQSLDLSLEPG